MADVQQRWMIKSDIEHVIQIERDSFEFAWTQEDFVSCLRQRACIGMVAEIGNVIHGFMIYELLKTQLHILNFAVAPESRHQGIGTQMVEKLKHKLSQQRRNDGGYLRPEDLACDCDCGFKVDDEIAMFPVDFPPGSPEKIAVLAARYRHGLEGFMVGDRIEHIGVELFDDDDDFDDCD